MVLIPILECLNDEDYYVRAEVITALGKIGDRSVLPFLVQKLNDTELFVIMNTAEALGKIGCDVATSALLKSLTYHDSNLRNSAMLGLAKIGTEVATEAIATTLLEDRNHMVRRKAAEILGNLESVYTVSTLLQALNDPQYYVRSQVVNSGSSKESMLKIYRMKLRHPL